MSVQLFPIKVPEQVLTDLRKRIERTRWPDEIIGSGWEYGASLSYMKELADHWLNKFDWRKVENEINAYPNFTADIDGYKVHFLHVKGKGKKSIPLIMTHGWPGSFLEMMKLIPLLTDSHDVVIPLLLGYGFSQKVTVPGCNIHLMADLWCKLMNELGYEKFGAHGGDFGSGVNTAMVLKYPQHGIGLHLNNIEGYYVPYLHEGERLSVDEIQLEKARTHTSSEQNRLRLRTG